jgi:hypothetical protein
VSYLAKSHLHFGLSHFFRLQDLYFPDTFHHLIRTFIGWALRSTILPPTSDIADLLSALEVHHLASEVADLNKVVYLSKRMVQVVIFTDDRTRPNGYLLRSDCPSCHSFWDFKYPSLPFAGKDAIIWIVNRRPTHRFYINQPVASLQDFETRATYLDSVVGWFCPGCSAFDLVSPLCSLPAHPQTIGGFRSSHKSPKVVGTKGKLRMFTFHWQH